MGYKDNIADKDVEKVRKSNNPPENEEGFDGSEEDIFDSLDDFGSDSEVANEVGNNQMGNNQMGNNQMGNYQMGNNQMGNYQMGNNQMGNNQMPVEKKDGFWDFLEEASTGVYKAFMETLKESIISIRSRNADDIGVLAKNHIVFGAIISVSFIVAGSVGAIGKVRVLKGSMSVAGAGIITAGVGLIYMGVSSAYIIKFGKAKGEPYEEGKDIVGELNDSYFDEDDSENTVAEGDFDNDFDEIDDFFDDDFFDDDFFDDDGDDGGDGDGGCSDKSQEDGSSKIRLEKDVVEENVVLTRERLVRTFFGMLPSSFGEFDECTDIRMEDREKIETVLRKALANVTNKTIEDIEDRLVEAKETPFSYELRFERAKKMSKITEFEGEIEAYFRENSRDLGVTAKVDVEGDFYNIVVTKNFNDIVSLKDTLGKKEVMDFFLDTKNALPIVMGITELGKVKLIDAKKIDSSMIMGTPRAGKSWFVLNMLMSLMMFNTPDDVSMVIIDPKCSNLFTTLGLMPHVIGVHSDDNVLQIMEEIIEVEGNRRKELLIDNRVDDIWALRKKGIKLPILYLVIDEVISVKNNLGALSKDFDKKMQTIISQLPSQGIRLIFVPHRATGVIDKTNRAMLSMIAAVKSNKDEIKDAFAISKWNKELTKPGDAVLKTSYMSTPEFVKGVVVTDNDDDNALMIERVAKAFYKMGVELPDSRSMVMSNNRNERKVREELEIRDITQYDSDNTEESIEGTSW